MAGRTRRSPTLCGSCPLRKMPGYRPFSDTELAFVSEFKSGELEVQAGATVLVDGHDSPHVFTVLEGWAVRLKELEDGSRQIINFAFPGDLVGLQSSLFDQMQHTVEALTPMRLCVFERAGLWNLYRDQPGLGFDTTWLAAREELFVAQHLVQLGQRTARERIAYTIVYIFMRAKASGLAKSFEFDIPVTQKDMADLMGLSAVHTNKVLKQLEREGLLKWSRSMINITDLEGLRDIAGEMAEPAAARPFL